MTKPPETSDVERLAGEPPTEVGALLRVQRKRLGLMRLTLAERLRLDERVIQALEHDDFGGLPEPVFVRGYLRGYARFVALDPEPLIAAYNRVTGEEPSGLGPALPASAVPPTPRPWPPGVAIAALGATLLGVVAVGGLWWWQQPIEQQLGTGASAPAINPLASDRSQIAAVGLVPPPRPAATIPDVSRTLALSEVTAFDPDPLQFEASSLSVGTTPVAPPIRPVSGPAFAPTVGRPVKRGAAPVPLQGPVAPPARRIESGSPVAEAAPPASPPAPKPATVAGAPRPTAAPARALRARPSRAPAMAIPSSTERAATVVLDFVADTWVEIRDADHVRRLTGIMKANTEKVVIGKSPFSLILGNSGGVQVTFNGQPVDHSTYTRGNVARFRLGDVASTLAER